jgi:hypothetical protein
MTISKVLILLISFTFSESRFLDVRETLESFSIEKEIFVKRDPEPSGGKNCSSSIDCKNNGVCSTDFLCICGEKYTKPDCSYERKGKSIGVILIVIFAFKIMFHLFYANHVLKIYILCFLNMIGVLVLWFYDLNTFMTISSSFTVFLFFSFLSFLKKKKFSNKEILRTENVPAVPVDPNEAFTTLNTERRIENHETIIESALPDGQVRLESQFVDSYVDVTHQYQCQLNFGYFLDTIHSSLLCFLGFYIALGNLRDSEGYEMYSE